MNLAPRELDKLVVYVVADLARKRQGRGLKLNYSEAVALITEAILEAARVVLVSRSISFGDTPIDTLGASALIVAAISWSVGSALTRKLPLPSSKAMSSGAQMLAGGVLLTLTATALGEFHGFRVQAVSIKAWLALGYLIVAGSIIAFTAYVWLIHHESPTKVGTYAYVNPVVAVLLGYFLGGEGLSLRTIIGTALVLVSVVVITTTPKKQVSPLPQVAEAVNS